jgi:hypothetical protein
VESAVAEESTLSVSRIVEWGLKGLIALLLGLVGFFVNQAYGTLSETGRTLTAFQQSVLMEMRGISGTITGIVTELHSHEDSDKALRQADTEVVKSFERRLLTMERAGPRGGMTFPIPDIPAKGP